MEQPCVIDVAKTYEFVPADPPYIVGREYRPDGSLAREFRFYDITTIVRSLFGGAGAQRALDLWISHLAAPNTEEDDIQHQAAS